jgi:cyclopropane fatty-acyl-phospholipid synthase-like methyltransferase
MERQTEPEIMEDFQQATSFSDARRKYSEDAFVYWYKDYCNVSTGVIADLGCGPAKYLIRLCNEYPDISFVGYDASKAMIDLARENIEQAGLSHRIDVRQSYFTDISDQFNCVISSGTLHHSHNPLNFWNTIKRIATGDIFIMDLVRPTEEYLVDRIVSTTAPNENLSFQRDFTNSLKAAFTIKEISEQLNSAGLSLTVTTKGDPSFIEIVLIHGKNNDHRNN